MSRIGGKRYLYKLRLFTYNTLSVQGASGLPASVNASPEADTEAESDETL
jgi:hypothetical protein